jgi:hypothetical protein
VRSAFLALGLVLLPVTAAASTQNAGPVGVVTRFYDWYLAQHGDVDWYAPQHGHVDWRWALEHHSAKYYQARPFFHPTLFKSLDETYFEGIGDNTPAIDVSTAPTLTLAGAKSTSPVTVIVRKNGTSHQIYNIHYGAIPFYYAGEIMDLQRFLGAYNC